MHLTNRGEAMGNLMPKRPMSPKCLITTAIDNSYPFIPLSGRALELDQNTERVRAQLPCQCSKNNLTCGNVFIGESHKLEVGMDPMDPQAELCTNDFLKAIHVQRTSITTLCIGFITTYLSYASKYLKKLEVSGIELTKIRNELGMLYGRVKASEEPISEDYIVQLGTLQSRASDAAVSNQVMFRRRK